MKKIYLGILLMAGALFFTGCRQESPKGIEHVVLIGLDGMSTWGFLAAHTPCMDSLMANGAYQFSVRSILPTVSTPNWTAMMSGVGPEGTGAVNNSWVNGALQFPHVAINSQNEVPTIFTIIREQKPDAVIGCIHNWKTFSNMYDETLLDLDEDYEEDADIARKSAAYIKEKKPDFMFCYFTDPDHTLHIKGHLSPEYLDVIGTLDGYVRTIVNAVHDAGIADKTLILVVSDHGGIFHAHGGNTHEELNTPIIFSGKGVKKNYQIKQQMYCYDLAANIAFALGLTPPQHWTGRPTSSAYTGFDEPTNLWVGAEVLPSPAFITGKISDISAYGGYWIDAPATVRIDSRPDVQDAEVRYTLDLSEPTRDSPLYKEPFTLDKAAMVKARVFGKNGESVTASSLYRIADTKSGNGLNYSVYHCPEYSIMPKSFAQLKPVATGTCYEFGFHAPENNYPIGINEAISRFNDHLGFVADGWLEIDRDDVYTFGLWSTGGSKLYIGSDLVINNGSNGHTGSDGVIALEKGRYPIRVEFFHIDQSMGSILTLTYASANIPKQVIPAQKLFKTK